MLPTPKECLGPGYPVCSVEVTKEYQPIWDLAFKIHKEAHLGDDRHRPGNIMPIVEHVLPNGTPYCDCYILAWLEVRSESVVVPGPPREESVDYTMYEERVI